MEKGIDITSYFFIDGTVFIIWHKKKMSAMMKMIGHP